MPVRVLALATVQWRRCSTPRRLLSNNRIWLGVNAANERAVRAYEKAGFVKEGLLRQEQFRNGRYDDVVRMAVLRDEYKMDEGRG